jgi:hypothetical protein
MKFHHKTKHIPKFFVEESYFFLVGCEKANLFFVNFMESLHPFNVFN